jgi:thioester reductase-like protein
VGGTREALRLACRHKTKPFHFVSTDGIFPPDAGLCAEDADLDSLADAREDGYGRSKWVAEKLVREAANRGLPACVYRPGFVSGHSQTGASNPRDLIVAVLSETLRLGVAPEVEGWRMDLTPVDFVAAAILGIAAHPSAAGGTYHLANPDPVPAGTIFDRLEDGGYDLERVTYGEWLGRLEPPLPKTGPAPSCAGPLPGGGPL